MKKHGPNEPCPCHSSTKYKKCCGRWHGGAPPPTPEALMRSRYAAYALELADYVIDTTAPETQAPGERSKWLAEIATFSRSTSFLGLEIKGTGSEGDAGWVHFRAILLQGPRDASFEERSQFVRRDGRWFYSGTTVASRRGER